MAEITTSAIQSFTANQKVSSAYSSVIASATSLRAKIALKAEALEKNGHIELKIAEHLLLSQIDDILWVIEGEE